MTDPSILIDLRSLAGQRCRLLIAQVLDQADDALFDLASKTFATSEQQSYLDAMRQLRVQRADIERHVLNEVGRSFQAPRTDDATEARALALTSDDFTLLSTEVLEEQIACERVDAAVSRQHAGALQRFCLAMAQVFGLEHLKDEDNPMAPLAIAKALTEGMLAVAMPVAARLVVLKLMERHFLGEFGKLLEELNNLLAERGIRVALPQRRLPGAGRSRPPRAVSGPAPPSDGAHREDQVEGRGDSDDNAGERGGSGYGGDQMDPMFAAMCGLFASYFGAAGMAAGTGTGGSPGTLPALPQSPAQAFAGMRSFAVGGVPAETASGPVLETRRLLEALDRMQDNPPRGLLRVVDDATVELGETIKLELLIELQRSGSQRGARLSGADEQALTLVGMLFDVLLDQGHFSDEVRGWFVRLLAPYAKVALLDQQVFAHRSHPARRLLNALAEMCDGIRGESSADRALLKQVRAVVDSLLDEFHDDPAIFSQLSRRVDQVMEQHAKRAQLAEKRNAETLRGKERLEEARIGASLEVATLIGDRRLPSALDEFIRRDWQHHLTMVSLRHTEDSDAYREAQRIGLYLFKAIVGCEQGRPPPEELAGQLRPVAQSTGRHHIEEVMEALCHLASPPPANPPAAPARPARESPAADWRKPDPAAPATRAPAVPAPAASTGEPPGAEPDVPAPPDDGFEIVSAPVPTAAAATASTGRSDALSGDLVIGVEAGEVDPALLAQVQALKAGDWIDLVDSAGETHPAKLSWVSPISRKLLFVNRVGSRLCLLSADECANLMAQGKFAPRSGDAAFDRAMHGLLGRLRAGREALEQGPVAD